MISGLQNRSPAPRARITNTDLPEIFSMQVSPIDPVGPKGASAIDNEPGLTEDAGFIDVTNFS